MSKKLKVLISAMVVALLLTVGATVTVMAEGEAETTPPPEVSENALLERVAAILGIDEEDLVNAFEQAQQEMKEEIFIKALDKAVEEGLITREQANEILEWWGQRPNDAIEAWRGQGPNTTGRGMFQRTLRSRAMPKFQMQNKFHMQNGTRWGFCPTAPEETN